MQIIRVVDALICATGAGTLTQLYWCSVRNRLLLQQKGVLIALAGEQSVIK